MVWCRGWGRSVSPELLRLKRLQEERSTGRRGESASKAGSNGKDGSQRGDAQRCSNRQEDSHKDRPSSKNREEAPEEEAPRKRRERVAQKNKRVEIALLAAALAAVPSSVLAQSAEIEVCGTDRALTRCEQVIYDAALTWEGRALECRAGLTGAMEKLRVRTATVVNRLVIPPPAGVKENPYEWVFLASSGVLGFVVGATIAVILTQ
jgi:hypothetical protein